MVWSNKLRLSWTRDFESLEQFINQTYNLGGVLSHSGGDDSSNFHGLIPIWQERNKSVK